MPNRSKSVKYVLIGGGLAAGQAAKQIREADTTGPIVLVGQEPYVPYDRPPLSTTSSAWASVSSPTRISPVKPAPRSSTALS